MMKPFVRIGYILACCALLTVGSGRAWAKTDLIWWHSMPGALGAWIDDLANGFNSQNPDYRIVPKYQGSYDASMQAALAAHGQGKAPHMVQVFEVGTATMMAARDVIRPVYEVMAQAGLDFLDNAYLPAVQLYYSSLDGKLLSLPLNSSTPVLVVSRKALAQAGVPPARCRPLGPRWKPWPAAC